MSLKIKVLWTDSDHYHQVSSTAGRGGNPDFALRNCSSLSWVQVLNWPGLGGGEEAVTPWESQQGPAGSQLLLKDCTPWPSGSVLEQLMENCSLGEGEFMEKCLPWRDPTLEQRKV